MGCNLFLHTEYPYDKNCSTGSLKLTMENINSGSVNLYVWIWADTNHNFEFGSSKFPSANANIESIPAKYNLADLDQSLHWNAVQSWIWISNFKLAEKRASRS